MDYNYKTFIQIWYGGWTLHIEVCEWKVKVKVTIEANDLSDWLLDNSCALAMSSNITGELCMIRIWTLLSWCYQGNEQGHGQLYCKNYLV